MLHIALYDETSSLYDLEFIQASSESTVIICPGPSIADSLTKKIGANHNLYRKTSIITIANYLKDEMLRKYEGKSIFKKAELVLQLSVVWKKCFSNLSFETYYQAFNCFTELRSFTPELDLAAEALAFYDEKIAAAIKVFWLYLDEMEIIDEHRAYSMLIEYYRTIENPEGDRSSNLIFWGFNQMSAIQVDLIKELATCSDVFIPFPKPVLNETTSGDWISWLKSDSPDCKIRDNSTHSCSSSFKMINFPKNRLCNVLSSFFQESHAELEDGVDILLAVKNPGYNHLAEIPHKNFYFKSSNDLFVDQIEGVVKLLKGLIKKEEGKLSSLKAKKYLEDLIKEEVQKSSGKINYRKLKVLSELNTVFVEWGQLSDANSNITLFDLKILELVVKLKMPRTFSSPLISSSLGSVSGLESIASCNSDNLTLVCASSSYSSFRGSKSLYNEEIASFLRTIGPVPRGELEYQILKFKIKEVLSTGHSVLFMEKGLVDYDPAWNEILDELDNPKIFELPTAPTAKAVDQLDGFIKKEMSATSRFSATKLQTYIDCPRKYFFRYIENITLVPKYSNTLLPNQLGKIEHELIEKYLVESREWDCGTHKSLVAEYFNKYLEKENINLSDLDYKRFLVEVENYSQNGIQTLLYFFELDPDVIFSFEFEISKSNQKEFCGKIDCLVQGKFGKVIIDFKRSDSGIPTVNELLNFKKIQLWFYLNHLESVSGKLILWGYLNLSDPSKTSFYSGEADFMDMDFPFGIKVKNWKENIGETLDKYSLFEADIICQLNSESQFLPMPQDPKVCRYCTVKNICTR